MAVKRRVRIACRDKVSKSLSLLGRHVLVVIGNDLHANHVSVVEPFAFAPTSLDILGTGSAGLIDVAVAVHHVLHA